MTGRQREAGPRERHDAGNRGEARGQRSVARQPREEKAESRQEEGDSGPAPEPCPARQGKVGRPGVTPVARIPRRPGPSATYTDRRLNIVGLVAEALRGWIAAAEAGDEDDVSRTSVGRAYSVFYIDAARPNEIQMRGALANRCELWVEPSDARAGLGGVELLVDVTIAHRRDGEPAITEFQVAFTDEAAPLVH